jgi:hypothetical protein
MARRPAAVADSLPLWPLPLLAAVIPLVVTHLAWWLSVRDGLVPACNPYLDGCASISRAARHGAGNDVFRMGMLPCAALQSLCWVVATAWLRRETSRAVSTLPWLGAMAGVALALYGTFLGTDGPTYELMRRYGNVIYFGSTGLALLVVLWALSRERAASAYRLLLVIALVLLAIGLGSVVVGYFVEEPRIRDAWRNVLEWHLALWLTGIYAVLAWAWRRERLLLSPR